MEHVDGFSLSAVFALLVAYPLTLRIDRDVPSWLRRTAFFAGIIASASILLPTGPVAACVAAVWFAFAVPNALYGLVRFVNAPDKRHPYVWAEAASVAGPLVGGAALVSSRWWNLFSGFPEPLAILTVTHFHFTFGLLPLSLAALTRRLRSEEPAGCGARGASAALWSIVFIPPVIGFFFTLRTEKAIPGYPEAAATAALALAVAAWSVFTFGKPALKLSSAASFTLRAAAVVLTLATAMGAWFSVVLAMGGIPTTYETMLHWHGVGNALATVALALVAMREAAFHGRHAAAPEPDLNAPTTDIPEEKAIFRDRRTFDMGEDAPGRFERMRDALLAYRFYPESVMESAAAFKTEKRFARVGDRIGMALLVPVFPGLPALRFPSTTEIHLVENNPERVVLGYITTRRHYGRGTWSATLLRSGGMISLELYSRMKPTAPIALLGLPIYRFMQKRAHRLGAENLRRA